MTVIRTRFWKNRFC